MIGSDPPAGAYLAKWAQTSDGPAGEYPRVFGGGATGTATVAEITEPTPEKILVLEWLSGPNAGKYTLLKERV